MAIEFSENTLEFPLTTGQVAVANSTTSFSTRVKKVHGVVMRGCGAGYPNTDRQFHELRARLTGTSIDSQDFSKVIVAGELLLDDDTGNIDGQYHGFIDYTVIAEV
jgi:hypothetical protein